MRTPIELSVVLSLKGVAYQDLATNRFKRLKIEDWINNYPRSILNYETAKQRFIKELAA